MRQIVLCFALLAAVASGAYAMKCYMCTPNAQNNFCTDYTNGFPAKATQQNCEGYCFKADGNMKLSQPSTNTDQRFVISDCIKQDTVDQLNIANATVDCKSGDEAKRLFRALVTPNPPPSPNPNPMVSQYYLPGSLDSVGFCKCQTDLCNSGMKLTSSASLLMAVVACCWALKAAFA